MGEKKKIESSASIFDCGDALAFVRGHEDGNLAVDFWRNQSYCNGDETPAIGILFDVQMAQKMINVFTEFIDIEIGDDSVWRKMIGNRVLFKVTDKYCEMKHDYYDAVVVDNAIGDDGTELVLLRFGDDDLLWTWVADGWLESSNRWFKAMSTKFGGE